MKKFPLFVLLFLFFSCNSTVKEQKNGEGTTGLSKIKQMEWLLGKWGSSSPKGDLAEIWTKANDSTYSGKSFMISGLDTVFSETMSLEARGQNFLYVPKLRDQNNTQPVPFKFISTENGEMIFENKEHDYPQRIIYKNPVPDSLYARIEGNFNGEFKKEEFSMKRSR